MTSSIRVGRTIYPPSLTVMGFILVKLWKGEGGGGNFPTPEDKKGIDRVNNLIFGYLIASFEKVSSGSGHMFFFDIR